MEGIEPQFNSRILNYMQWGGIIWNKAADVKTRVNFPYTTSLLIVIMWRPTYYLNK